MHLSSFAYRISTASPRPPHGEQNPPGARSLRSGRRAAAASTAPPFPTVLSPFRGPPLFYTARANIAWQMLHPAEVFRIVVNFHSNTGPTSGR